MSSERVPVLQNNLESGSLESVSYEMLLLQLLCFDIHAVSWGVPLQPRKEIMNISPESSTCAVIRPEVTIDTEPSRCHHRFANGKRCRLPATDSQLGLCFRHFTLHAAANLARQTAHDDTEDLSAELLGQASGSGAPLDMKQFLSRLVLLVSQGRISPRRSAVLVYIANQILYSQFANRR